MNQHSRTYFPAIAFAVAVLLFLLPFVKIEVGDEEVATLSGTEIMIGKATEKETIGTNNERVTIARSEDIDRNIYVILSAISGFAGLVVCFLSFRRQKTVASILGFLAAIFLSILYFQITNQSDNLLENIFRVVFKVEFTPWYFLAMIAFLIAGLLSIVRKPNYGGSSPSKAPQLNIDNPGDQSEFPKSASESEIG